MRSNRAVLFTELRKKTMSKLKIKKWDPTTLRKDACVLLLGKRGTGKSTLMRDLMYRVKDKLDYGIAMSPTEEASESLGTFLPPSWIYNDFDRPAIERLMNLQRKQWKREQGGKNVFLLLDDCMYDKAIFRGESGKLFRSLMMNGRHRRIFFLNCQQYCMDMPPDLRSQVDVVFQLRDNQNSSRKKTFENFFGFFSSYDQFCRTLDATTENYECLVYDSRCSQSNSITDSVFWYKADPNLPEFRVGSSVFWSLHERYYDSRKEEAIESGAIVARKDTKVIKGDQDGNTVRGGPLSTVWEGYD